MLTFEPSIPSHRADVPLIWQQCLVRKGCLILTVLYLVSGASDQPLKWREDDCYIYFLFTVTCNLWWWYFVMKSEEYCPNTYCDCRGTYLYRSLHLYSHVPSISVSAMPSLSFLFVDCYWTESYCIAPSSICCSVNSYYLLKLLWHKWWWFAEPPWGYFITVSICIWRRDVSIRCPSF